MPSLRARQERGEAPEATMVTPRDVLLLRALAETGGLTGSHLSTLLGMSPEMVRRRCRLLKAAALVNVQASSPQLPNIYTLGPKAPAHLSRVLGRLSSDFPVPKLPISWGFHHELILALYIAFQVGLARSKEWRLDLFEFEPAIRKRVGEGGGVIIPDSIIVLERHDGRKVAAALEADTGAENPGYLAQRKQVEFSQARERGGKLRGVEQWVVLWLSAPDMHRRNRIIKAAWAAGCAPGLHYFLALPELDPRTILESWWTPRPYGDVARLIQESPFDVVAGPVVVGGATGHCDEGSGARSDGRYGLIANNAGGSVITGADNGGCFRVQGRS